MQADQFSRRALLKGIGAGAFVLGMSRFASHIQAQEETNLMDITIEDAQIVYETRGEGIPLLILHGFPLDHEVMLGAFEPIFANRPGYQRIYPDVPGLGRSPASESVQNSDDVLRVMTEFINELAPDQNFLVAGFSYGGYIAQGMVHQIPERIDGVMMHAPMVNPIDTERIVPEHIVIASEQEAIDMVPEPAQPLILGTTVVQTQAVIGRILTEFGGSLSRGDAEFIGSLRQPENYGFSYNVKDVDTTFDKPSLIITGRQDVVVGYAEAFEVYEQYTRATYATLDRAGHALHVEQSGLFNALVHEWLNRVEEHMAM